MRTATAFSVLLLVAACPLAAIAQDVAPLERISKAADIDSLDTIQSHPWHIKLDITLWDAKGENKQTGTAEAWQSGGDRRVVYTFGNTSLSEIVNGSSVYRSAPSQQFPLYAAKVFGTILHGGPPAAQIKFTTIHPSKHELEGKDLDCIATLPPAMKDAESKPFGYFSTYCLDDLDHLRAAYNYKQVILFTGAKDFLGHNVPTDLSIAYEGVTLATAKVVTLDTYEPRPQEFVPTADMTPFVQRARISGGVMSGNILSKTAPEYPASALANHIGGTVVLHAIIGADGHVKSVEAVTPLDNSLAQAAIQAVKQWTYKPYMLNGTAVEVDTTITVNFNLK